jgi:hypothetical protein
MNDLSQRKMKTASTLATRKLRRITSMMLPRRTAPLTKDALLADKSMPRNQKETNCLFRYRRLGTFLRKFPLFRAPSAMFARKPVKSDTSLVVSRQSPSLLIPRPGTIFSVNPRQLQFSLKFIPDSFADGPRLDNLVRAVHSGLLSTTALTPLRVRRGVNGGLYAVDCRRLYVLREANVTEATAIEMPGAMTEEEIERAGGNQIHLVRSRSETSIASAIHNNTASVPTDQAKDDTFRLVDEATRLAVLANHS